MRRADCRIQSRSRLLEVLRDRVHLGPDSRAGGLLRNQGGRERIWSARSHDLFDDGQRSESRTASRRTLAAAPLAHPAVASADFQQIDFRGCSRPLSVCRYRSLPSPMRRDSPRQCFSIVTAPSVTRIVRRGIVQSPFTIRGLERRGPWRRTRPKDDRTAVSAAGRFAGGCRLAETQLANPFQGIKPGHRASWPIESKSCTLPATPTSIAGFRFCRCCSWPPKPRLHPAPCPLDAVTHSFARTTVVVLASCGRRGTRRRRRGTDWPLQGAARNRSRNVVLSIQPVSDDSGSFFVDFHRALRITKDPATALRTAQLRAFRADRSVPLNQWAGFTSFGGRRAPAIPGENE